MKLFLDELFKYVFTHKLLTLYKFIQRQNYMNSERTFLTSCISRIVLVLRIYNLDVLPLLFIDVLLFHCLSVCLFLLCLSCLYFPLHFYVNSLSTSVVC